MIASGVARYASSLAFLRAVAASTTTPSSGASGSGSTVGTGVAAELPRPAGELAGAAGSSGRRSHISVAELLVLARALNVPPVVLLTPVGTAESAEILPGVSRPPFRAAQWITGEAPFPGEDDKAYLRGIAADWRAAYGGALELYRAYEREVAAEADKLRRALGMDERALTAIEEERAWLAGAAAGLRREAEEHRASAESIRAGQRPIVSSSRPGPDGDSGQGSGCGPNGPKAWHLRLSCLSFMCT